jgi:hypothetical protein
MASVGGAVRVVGPQAHRVVGCPEDGRAVDLDGADEMPRAGHTQAKAIGLQSAPPMVATQHSKLVAQRQVDEWPDQRHLAEKASKQRRIVARRQARPAGHGHHRLLAPHGLGWLLRAGSGQAP